MRIRDPFRHARRAARGQHAPAAFMRSTHDTCDKYDDVATASLLECGSMRPSAGVFLYERAQRLISVRVMIVTG